MVSEALTAPLPPIVIVAGPTAAGKTDLAMKLARELPVGLINADSAQVYRGLDIGSAKPEPTLLAEFPHALIDIREPEQAYSAAEFVNDCTAEIRRLHGQGRLPVVVGGTGLYLRALIYGLDELPGADPAVRRSIAARASARGWPALHAELAAADPVAAAAISPKDPQRIQRALEILQLSGKGPSHFQRHNRLPRGRSLRIVVAAPDRRRLHARIEQRFDAMLARGFLDEVSRLRRRSGLTLQAPAMKSVGYRQAWQHLDGALDAAGFRERAIAATRQLAKRQITALRQLGDALWYDPDGVAAVARIRKRAAVLMAGGE